MRRLANGRNRCRRASTISFAALPAFIFNVILLHQGLPTTITIRPNKEKLVPGILREKLRIFTREIVKEKEKSADLIKIERNIRPENPLGVA